MIDTHCHLLPGLDDGPADDAGALELARALVDDEIRLVVCTPHYSRHFPTEHAAAEAALARLRSQLAEAGVQLELALAAEVGPVFALDAPAEELTRRALAGRFVLVEVTPDSPAPFFDAVGERLAREGLTPVFAHPERSRAVQRSLDALADARGAGGLMQVVAPSLLGRWPEPVATTAWQIIDAGLADLLASDAHGIARRRVHLGEAAEEVGHRYGHAAARLLTAGAPARVVEGLDPQS